jgi:hypothetical protein
VEDVADGERFERVSVLLGGQIGELLAEPLAPGTPVVRLPKVAIDTLEVFLSEALRSAFPDEWSGDSIDGVFVARVDLVKPRGVCIAGTCVLCVDQTVTPFFARVKLAEHESLVESFEVGVGEPGTGTLGISGPPSNSHRAAKLLNRIGQLSELEKVEWAFVCEAP